MDICKILLFILLLFIVILISIWIYIFIVNLRKKSIIGSNEKIDINKYKYTDKDLEIIKKICENNPYDYEKYDDLNIDIDELEYDEKSEPTDHIERYEKYDSNIFHVSPYKGQRKLLLGEMYFMTKYGDLSSIVIYVGAAPGHHINTLVRLFPDHKYYLYDPRDFDDKLSKLNNVNIRQEYFTEEHAKKWKDKNVLFISDIRDLNYGVSDIEKKDKLIIEDMNFQKSWINMINPIAATLKFKLPHKLPIKLNYFKGEIIYQPYTKHTTSESRLLLTREDINTNMDYSSAKYNKKMVMNNMFNREWKQFNKFEYVDYEKYDINNLWDCTSELWIIKYYIDKFGQERKMNINYLLGIISRMQKNKDTYKLLNTELCERRKLL